MKNNHFSNSGLDLLCELEGFRSKPYLDSKNIPTIGIGTTLYPNGTRVTMKDKPITKQEALIYASTYVGKLEDWINNNCRWDPNQNEFDALICFLYNTGIGSKFNSYTQTKAAIIKGDKPAIISGMKSIRNQGLLDSRRVKECKRFEKA